MNAPEAMNLAEPADDRRSDARFDGPLLDDLRITLRPGCIVSIVNLSAGGALVHASRPLRPGASVYLQVVTRHRAFVLRACLLRCSVASVSSETGVIYSGAIRFEEPCSLFWESRTHGGYLVPPPRTAAVVSEGQQLPASPHTSSSSGRRGHK